MVYVKPLVIGAEQSLARAASLQPHVKLKGCLVFYDCVLYISPALSSTDARQNHMDLTDVLTDPPKPHDDSRGGFMVMGLTEAALKFIYENVDESCVTLETGCGLST